MTGWPLSRLQCTLGSPKGHKAFSKRCFAQMAVCRSLAARISSKFSIAQADNATTTRRNIGKSIEGAERACARANVTRREQIEEDGEVEPALCGPHVGEVPGPHSVKLCHRELTIEGVRRYGEPIWDWMVAAQARGSARTVLSAIRVIHRELRETYGSPRIWDALLKQVLNKSTRDTILDEY